MFKDPSLLGSYQGDPPLPLPTGSTQVCFISFDGVEIHDESSLEKQKLQPTTEIFTPQPIPKTHTSEPSTDYPSMNGKIPICKMVPQSITQISFFYSPPGVTTYQVFVTLNFPNMVITIPLWYLEKQSMIPIPYIPPQLEVFPMQPMVQTPLISTGHTVG
jgi:hypothetical protein